MTTTPRGRARLVGALLTAALLSGGGAAWALTQPLRTAALPTSPAPTPVLVVAGSSAGAVRWQDPLHVRVLDARLIDVDVSDANGRYLDGHLAHGTWTSTTSLVPSTTYTVFATVVDAAGTTRRLTLRTRSTPASLTLRAVLSPDSDSVVGIGLPVIVTLNRPVTDPADRRAVESRLSVTTEPAVSGAWRWMNPQELHYRGPTYWAKGTVIRVRAELQDLQLSHGVWGEGIVNTRYEIGSAVVATVDVATKLMKVTVDGVLVRTVKVSTGRDKYPTKGGVHIVLEKIKLEVMDSATVGIPRNSPDGYYEKVPNSVRISYGGAFVHSASWSVADQGVRNVSHGCVNISPADSAWFFALVRRGDIVDVINAKAPPLISDPGMSDWNIPFSAWAN